MRDALLLSLAVATVLLAGCGAALLVLPRERRVGAPELLAVGYLLGAAIVSVLSFSGGVFLSGRALQLVVLGAGIAFGAAGVASRRRTPPGIRPEWKEDPILVAAPLVVAAAAGWLSLRLPMGWDGVMTWDARARLAWMSGGGLPLRSFSEPYRAHPDYPLLLPMLEAWVYGWLGRGDQMLVKVLFAGFALAGLWLLVTAASRLGLRPGWSLLAALLPACVPRLVAGEGSASSGYADFPLAVYYLACVVYLLEYVRERRPEALRVAGVLAAALPWVKQEGAILWACFALFAAAVALVRRERALLWWALAPGLLVLVAWQVLLAVTEALPGGPFLPVRPATFWRNVHRLGLVWPMLWREVSSLDHWSVLWPVAAFSGVAAWRLRAARDGVALLAAAVVVPTVLYSMIYIFSAHPRWHITTSMPRLLIQVSLPAVLLVLVPAAGWAPGSRYSRR